MNETIRLYVVLTSRIIHSYPHIKISPLTIIYTYTSKATSSSWNEKKIHFDVSYRERHFDLTLQCLFSLWFSIHFRVALYSICMKLIVPMLRALPLFYSIEAVDFITYTASKHTHKSTHPHARASARHTFDLKSRFYLLCMEIGCFFLHIHPSIIFIFSSCSTFDICLFRCRCASQMTNKRVECQKHTQLGNIYIWIIYGNHHFYLHMECMRHKQRTSRMTNIQHFQQYCTHFAMKSVEIIQKRLKLSISVGALFLLFLHEYCIAKSLDLYRYRILVPLK